MRKIIIASQSPRRRELMTQAGYEFVVIPSESEERITNTFPEKVVCELSYQKAEDVYDRTKCEEDVLVIGADTIVSIDGRIIGKPADRQEAVSILKELEGRVHEVYTGVTFVWNQGMLKQSHTFCECTRVEFYPMTDREIEGYVDSGDCMDKAGAYGIQGAFAVFIKGIEGDYNNVVGLPIARIYQELKLIGIDRDI